MGRMLGILFGLGTHALFGVTVWHLFWFLKDGAAPGDAVLVRDAVLALQFGVIHSLILLPAARRRLNNWIPAGLYGCFFCAMTCLSLLATFAYWRASPVILWSLAGWPRTWMQTAFVAAWAGLIYSLSLTGLGYQTGWTPFYYWLRGEPMPRREFVPRGAYRFLRHPV